MRRFPPILPPLPLAEFATDRVKRTVSWLAWVERLGIERATRRACCAFYQDWVNFYFPLNGHAELGKIECVRLRDAWLAIGHPADQATRLFAIGSREGRWIMPDAALLDRVLAASSAGCRLHPAPTLT